MAKELRLVDIDILEAICKDLVDIWRKEKDEVNVNAEREKNQTTDSKSYPPYQ